MKMAIVPNSLRDAINERLNTQIAIHPDAEADRDALYSMLLEYFDEHGVIPDFSLQKSVTLPPYTDSELLTMRLVGITPDPMRLPHGATEDNCQCEDCRKTRMEPLEDML